MQILCELPHLKIAYYHENGNWSHYHENGNWPMIMKMEIGLMVRPGLDGLCGIPVLPSHCIHTAFLILFVSYIL